MSLPQYCTCLRRGFDVSKEFLHNLCGSFTEKTSMGDAGYEAVAEVNVEFCFVGIGSIELSLIDD